MVGVTIDWTSLLTQMLKDQASLFVSLKLKKLPSPSNWLNPLSLSHFLGKSMIKTQLFLANWTVDNLNSPIKTTWYTKILQYIWISEVLWGACTPLGDFDDALKPDQQFLLTMWVSTTHKEGKLVMPPNPMTF